jgi:hypothetical protein
MDLLARWQRQFGRHRHRAVWRMVPHCVMWCLWREMNARHFENCEKTVPELKLLIFQTLYEWVLALGSFSLPSLVELLIYLGCPFNKIFLLIKKKYLFALVNDELTKSIQEDVPWCMLFADDIVLVDETRRGVNVELEIWRHFRTQRLSVK